MAGQASLGTTISGAGGAWYANVVSVSGPGLSGNDVDISILTDVVQSFVPGKVDGGEVTLGLRYDQVNGTAIVADIIAGAVIEVFTVTFPDATNFIFSGYLKGYSTDVPDDGSVDAEVTIKVANSTSLAITV